MGSSAGRLASALAGGAPSNVSQPLRAFDRAVASEHSVAAQRAQIAALRAYNAQRMMVTRLAQEIQTEQARLSDTVK
jgi:hypothetical protein